MNELSLSDIATVTRDNDGFGTSGGWLAWIFLFAILGGGNGFFGGRNQAATTEEVAAGFNFAGINNKLNELTAGQANINQNLGNAICQLGYQSLDHANQLGSKIDSCCCDTQLGIQGVRFDMANYAAATNMTIVENTQKILDKMCADQTAALQARVQSLELQQALCGIPKTNPYGYGIYAYPTCNPCGCGNGSY